MKYNIPTEPYINLQDAVIDAAFFSSVTELEESNHDYERLGGTGNYGFFSLEPFSFYLNIRVGKNEPTGRTGG